MNILEHPKEISDAKEHDGGRGDAKRGEEEEEKEVEGEGDGKHSTLEADKSAVVRLSPMGRFIAI